MYAGRGGTLNVKNLTHSNTCAFAEYLDMLYWVYRMFVSNHQKIGTLRIDYSLCEFIKVHLQKTMYYDPLAMEKIHKPIELLIDSLKTKTYKVYISCLWTTTAQLYEDWKYLFDDVGSLKILGYDNGSVRFILTKDKNTADYFCIVWGSRENYTDEELSRTIFFRTEPCFPEKLTIGKEVAAEPFKFLRYYDYHDLRFPNCMENWLHTSSADLLSSKPHKPDHLKFCMSSVVSNKYVDPGHKYRVDLLRYMISHIKELCTVNLDLPDYCDNSNKTSNTYDASAQNILHLYGFDNKLGFPSEYYFGPLPERDKSILMQYRYTLIAENHSIPGYMTEKIADGILSECLVFYWGCPNIEHYYPRVNGFLPYVVLPMEDPVESFKIIKTAIENDWWSERYEAITKTKKLILSQFMMKHRIAQVIQEDVDKHTLGEDAMNLLRLVTATKPFGENLPDILYTGERYNELKNMIERNDPHSTIKFSPYNGSSENIPANIILIQELSNKPTIPIKKSNTFQNIPMQHYTIGFTRFCTSNPVHTASLPKAYVINLDRRSDRLKQFESRFPSYFNSRWTYERFTAVDGNKLHTNGVFSRGIQHLFRNNDFCSKASVIGCAMSHIKLWQKLVDDQRNESYVIYEDDVQFVESYTWKLYALLQQITFDWDVLYLGHLVCYEWQTTHRIESDELPKWENMINYIVPNRTSWVGTASYIISKRGARKLLEYIEQNGVQHGIDYLMQLRFKDLLRAYGVNPMINFAEYESPLNPNKNVDTDIQK
jgi:glycosyl transferase family 25